MTDAAFRTVDIETPDGTMATEIFNARDNRRGPAIIVYMDARGVRDELREMCRRLAAPGYTVILPDLYHRHGRQVGFPSETSTGTPEELDTIIRHIKSTTIAGVMSDTAALFAWIDAAPDVQIGRVGVVGYCMGGPFAFAAAVRFSDRVAAAASFYGVGCMADDPSSPHHGAADVRGELYFAYAEKDHLAPPTEMQPLGDLLTAAGVSHRIDLYTGVDHGFAFPRRAAYDEAAAERHWGALFDLYARTLV